MKSDYSRLIERHLYLYSTSRMNNNPLETQSPSLNQWLQLKSKSSYCGQVTHMT